jgi:hypothetical protein
MLFHFSALFGALIGVAGLYNGTLRLTSGVPGWGTTFKLAAIFAGRMAAVFPG